VDLYPSRVLPLKLRKPAEKQQHFSQLLFLHLVQLTEVKNRFMSWLTVDFTEELRYQTAEVIILVDICLVNNQRL